MSAHIVFRLKGQATLKLCLSTAWVWETLMTFTVQSCRLCLITLCPRLQNKLLWMLNVTSLHLNLWCWSNCYAKTFLCFIYYLCQGQGYDHVRLSVCEHVSVILSMCRITAKVIGRLHWNLVLWLGHQSEELVKFGGDPVPDTGSMSLFHFPHHFGIGHFSRFISISHTVISHFQKN